MREKATILGLKNTFGLSRAEWIRMVQGAEGNLDGFGMATASGDQYQDCLGKIAQDFSTQEKLTTQG